MKSIRFEPRCWNQHILLGYFSFVNINGELYKKTSMVMPKLSGLKQRKGKERIDEIRATMRGHFEIARHRARSGRSCVVISGVLMIFLMCVPIVSGLDSFN
jgi:hypothetical protein